jgi:hypothetical protein
MEYEAQIQINRIEAKMDILVKKLCPELFEEVKDGS